MQYKIDLRKHIAKQTYRLLTLFVIIPFFNKFFTYINLYFFFSVFSYLSILLSLFSQIQSIAVRYNYIHLSLSIYLCLPFPFLSFSIPLCLFLHLIKFHNKTPRPFSTPQYTNSYTKDINSSSPYMREEEEEVSQSNIPKYSSH